MVLWQPRLPSAFAGHGADLDHRVRSRQPRSNPALWYHLGADTNKGIENLWKSKHCLIFLKLDVSSQSILKFTCASTQAPVLSMVELSSGIVIHRRVSFVSIRSYKERAFHQ